MPGKLKTPNNTEISTDKKLIRTLKLYIKSQLLLLLVNSIIFFLVLSLFKVKYALYLAIITGILSVVPTFGVMISALISMAVSVFDGQSPFAYHPLVDALLLFLAYIVVNQIIDLVLSHYIIGKVIKISPLV